MSTTQGAAWQVADTQTPYTVNTRYRLISLQAQSRYRHQNYLITLYENKKGPDGVLLMNYDIITRADVDLEPGENRRTSCYHIITLSHDGKIKSMCIRLIYFIFLMRVVIYLYLFTRQSANKSKLYGKNSWATTTTTHHHLGAKKKNPYSQEHLTSGPLENKPITRVHVTEKMIL